MLKYKFIQMLYHLSKTRFLVHVEQQHTDLVNIIVQKTIEKSTKKQKRREIIDFLEYTWNTGINHNLIYKFQFSVSILTPSNIVLKLITPVGIHNIIDYWWDSFYFERIIYNLCRTISTNTLSKYVYIGARDKLAREKKLIHYCTRGNNSVFIGRPLCL